MKMSLLEKNSNLPPTHAFQLGKYIAVGYNFAVVYGILLDLRILDQADIERIQKSAHSYKIPKVSKSWIIYLVLNKDIQFLVILMIMAYRNWTHKVIVSKKLIT